MTDPVIEICRDPDGWVKIMIAADPSNALIIRAFRENVDISGRINGQPYNKLDAVYMVLDLILDKLNEARLIC